MAKKDAVEVLKCRAYKVQADAMTSFLGQTVQIDIDGSEYFELDASLKSLAEQNQNLIWVE